jgi:hypothetical protein
MSTPSLQVLHDFCFHGVYHPLLHELGLIVSLEAAQRRDDRYWKFAFSVKLPPALDAAMEQLVRTAFAAGRGAHLLRALEPGHPIFRDHPMPQLTLSRRHTVRCGE